uniref:Uncharacterized protein n=1 Tax=viral metagenome TaxID=1070528 RepID=A0A6C0C8F0_9ZZZZ
MQYCYKELRLLKNYISYSIDRRTLNAMLLQRIIFAGELHVIFNRSPKVECNVAVKNYVCWRIACHIQ